MTLFRTTLQVSEPYDESQNHFLSIRRIWHFLEPYQPSDVYIYIYMHLPSSSTPPLHPLSTNSLAPLHSSPPLPSPHPLSTGPPLPPPHSLSTPLHPFSTPLYFLPTPLYTPLYNGSQYHHGYTGSFFPWNNYPKWTVINEIMDARNKGIRAVIGLTHRLLFIIAPLLRLLLVIRIITIINSYEIKFLMKDY